jgi:hypothetical protein
LPLEIEEYRSLRETAEILADPAALRGPPEAREAEQADDVVYGTEAARAAGRAQAVSADSYELGMTRPAPARDLRAAPGGCRRNALLAQTPSDAGVPAIGNNQADDLTGPRAPILMQPEVHDGALLAITIDPAIPALGSGHGEFAEAVVTDGAPLSASGS